MAQNDSERILGHQRIFQSVYNDLARQGIMNHDLLTNSYTYTKDPFHLEDYAFSETVKAITAYKDKAVEEVLDRLEKECHSIAMFPDGTGDYEVVPLSAIQAERNKLKGDN